jgi:hypothetical protein
MIYIFVYHLLGLVCVCILEVFKIKIKIFIYFLLQINFFIVFSNHFDMLMLKIIFKNKKILF